MSDVHKVKPFVEAYVWSFSGHFLIGAWDFGVLSYKIQQGSNVFRFSLWPRWRSNGSVSRLAMRFWKLPKKLLKCKSFDWQIVLPCYNIWTKLS